MARRPSRRMHFNAYNEIVDTLTGDKPHLLSLAGKDAVLAASETEEERADAAFELLCTFEADMFVLALDALGWKIVEQDPGECPRLWPLNLRHTVPPTWCENG